MEQKKYRKRLLIQIDFEELEELVTNWLHKIAKEDRIKGDKNHSMNKPSKKRKIQCQGLD